MSLCYATMNTFSCFQNYMRFMTTIIFIIKEAEKCNDFFIFNKSCHCCHYSEESSGTIFSLSRLKWLLMMIHLLLLSLYNLEQNIDKKTIELKKFKIKTCWLRNIVCNWWASEFAKEKTGFFFAFSHSVNDEIDDYRKRFQVIGKAQ